MIDIIATIGPSTEDYSVLRRMAKEGMTIARVNMKYASVDELVGIKKKLDKLDVGLLVDILSVNEFASVKNIDFGSVALAFTESVDQISRLRAMMGHEKRKIISKIETKAGVNHIGRIIDASDGLMVARGDLGNNVKLEELPFYQKRIIRECNKRGKYVITATEMLLSMVSSKKPTKSEVSDVANAVIDGSNALMLSEETAIGKHPVQAVKVMKKIIDASRKYMDGKN